MEEVSVTDTSAIQDALRAARLEQLALFVRRPRLILIRSSFSCPRPGRRPRPNAPDEVVRSDAPEQRPPAGRRHVALVAPTQRLLSLPVFSHLVGPCAAAHDNPGGDCSASAVGTSPGRVRPADDRENPSGLTMDSRWRYLGGIDATSPAEAGCPSVCGPVSGGVFAVPPPRRQTASAVHAVASGAASPRDHGPHDGGRVRQALRPSAIGGERDRQASRARRMARARSR